MKSKLPSCIVILCFTILSCSSVFSQSKISGYVLDGKTNTPIEGASVYFNNTTIGITSDVNGAFTLEWQTNISSQLIISYIGYESMQTDNYKTDASQTFYLYSTEEILDEVVIVAKEGWSRALKLEEFKKHYFGESANGRACKILNEDDLILTYDDENKQLRAKSKAPIIINNYALKYKITTNLKHFEANYAIVTKNKKGMSVKDVFYAGENYFKSLETYPTKLTKQKREEAYEGSILHFMRALLKKQLTANGFVLVINNKSISPSTYIKRIPNLSGDGVWISATEAFNVLYKDEQKSSFLILVDRIYIDEYGNHSPANGVKFDGYFAQKCMGNTLPLDYGY